MRQRLEESEQLLEARNVKLAEAQQAQAEALRKQRELDEKTREIEVTIEKRVQARQAELVAKARQDASDDLKSQVSQKDAQIESLGRTVEEMIPKPTACAGSPRSIRRRSRRDDHRGAAPIFTRQTKQTGHRQMAFPMTSAGASRL
jgi:recombination DNA repair RAD52 pathway protein